MVGTEFTYRAAEKEKQGYTCGCLPKWRVQKPELLSSSAQLQLHPEPSFCPLPPCPEIYELLWTTRCRRCSLSWVSVTNTIWSSAAFLNSKIKPHEGQAPSTRGRVLLKLIWTCLAKQSPLQTNMERPLGLKQAREGASGRSLCPNGRKYATAGVYLDRDHSMSKDTAEWSLSFCLFKSFSSWGPRETVSTYPCWELPPRLEGTCVRHPPSTFQSHRSHHWI